MNIVEIPVETIIPAPWNSNEMDENMLYRLRESIRRFGMIVPLVVRQINKDDYETIGGAQRLNILKEMKSETVPCVVVTAEDSEARLLSLALNSITGSDNYGTKAEIMKEVLQHISKKEVLSILPETITSLEALTELTHMDIGEHLKIWEAKQKTRLFHITFQLTKNQMQVVEDVLNKIRPLAREEQNVNPNIKGNTLYLLCKSYLQNKRGEV